MPTPSSSSGWEADPRLPVAESLLALAPRHLPNRRRTRSFGDHLCVALERLATRDQTLVRALYETLAALLYAIVDTTTDDGQKWRDVTVWAERGRLDTLLDEVQELGKASHAQESSEGLAKAMHDVRGGALSALLGRLQLLGRTPQTPKALNLLFVLVRDHLKIMRSAITGLDDARRNADRQPRSHHMRLMVEKWHESVIGPKWREQPIHMFVDCRYEGAISKCCLESAAVDRIFYNLVHNACRHAASDRLEMAIFPIPEAPGDCLRFVLSNEVDATDETFLKAVVHAGGADSADKGTSLSLFSLFEPQVSSTGAGFGLTVVADFIAEAFGLRDRAEALRERYVGAILDGQTFRVWFHWPRASDDVPQMLDEYQRPKESLSEP